MKKKFTLILTILCISLSATAQHAFGNFDMGAIMSNMPEGPTGHVDFESSDLPLIQLFTDSLRITKQNKITARMKITDYGQGKRNRPSDPANVYDGFIAIKVRGNSSAAFTQKRYTLELRNKEGKSKDEELLGMPANDDWVLLGPYNDRSMMRDALAFDLWTQMGHWGSRTRYAELLLNGEYRGIYLLTEKIKRGHDRLDIGKAGVNKKGAPKGGYILRIDVTDDDCHAFQSTVEGVGAANGFGAAMLLPVTWNVFYPKKDKLKPEQQTYVEQYVAKAEQAIKDSVHYDQYIDIASFVDYFIHTELSLNADGFKRSAYFYLDHTGSDDQEHRLHAGPVWDYNLAYGNCNFCSASDINAFVYNGCETNPTPAMWKSLASNPSFMKLVRKRYAELRKTILSNEHLDTYIDQRAQLLSEAQQRHFAKYPTLLEGGTVPQDNTQTSGNRNVASLPAGGFPGFGGGQGFPGFPGFEGGQGFPGFPGFEGGQGFPGFGAFGGFGGMGGGDTSWFDAYTPKDFADEIQILKKWLADRLSILDNHWK